MGLDITKILHSRGYTVYACDTYPGAIADLAKEGGAACVISAEMATGVGMVVSMVINAAQTEATLFGKADATSAMRRGSMFAMRSTADPNWLVALEVYPTQQDILYADDPISNGAAKVASGQMTVMISATSEVCAATGDAFDVMTGKVYHLVDRAGAGSKVKIINQLLAGVYIAAAAKAMALGLCEGVAADVSYEATTHSTGNSWMFGNRTTHVLAGDYTPLSVADIFVKDLGLVLDIACADRFLLPLTTTTYQALMQAFTAGYVREDDSAVIKIFPGITPSES